MYLTLGLFSVSLFCGGILYARVSDMAKIKYLLPDKLQGQTLTGIRSGLTAIETEETRQGYTSGRIVTLFTTLRDVKVRERVHNQTLKNWASLAPAVLSVLYLMPNDRAYWTRRATELGWKVEKVPRTRAGVPVVKDMYNVTSEKYPSPFIGFANADIMFGNSLVQTLVGLTQNNKELVHGGMSLIVGRRRRIEDSKVNDTSGEYVDSIAPHLRMYSRYGQDYFLFGNGGKFHWDRVPDFVVGRLGYDNWFVVMAQRWNITLIDGTQTLHIFHQVGKDGVSSSRVLNKGKDKRLNYKVVGKFSYRGGATTCAFWRSVNCSLTTNNIIGRRNSSICLNRTKHRRQCRNPGSDNEEMGLEGEKSGETKKREAMNTQTETKKKKTKKKKKRKKKRTN